MDKELKKLKRKFFITFLVGILVIVSSVYIYLNPEIFADITNIDRLKDECMIVIITATIMSSAYFVLFTTRKTSYIYRGWIFVVLSILSIFSSPILFIMNFFTVNSVSNYVLNKRMQQRIFIVKDGNKIQNTKNVNNVNSENSNDDNQISDSTILFADSIKKRENNEISEEEFQNIRKKFYSEIGMDYTKIKEVKIEPENNNDTNV